MTTKVYEVRVTYPWTDGQYYPFGIYTNFKLCVDHLEEYFKKGESLGDFSDDEGEDIVVVEIPLNTLTDRDKTVYTVTRRIVYNEEEDEYRLEVVETECLINKGDTK